MLLSHRANLSPEKRRRLQTLLAANKRLNTAYVLKELFGQLWEYRREPGARNFFDQWRAALRWQRLQPFEKFAALSPLEDPDLHASAAATDLNALEFTHTNPRRALNAIAS